MENLQNFTLKEPNELNPYILTVGELKKIIADLPDNMEVAISEIPDGEYKCWMAHTTSIEGVVDDEEDEGDKIEYSTLILKSY